MHEGLPVKGYVAQSSERVVIVNAHKVTEETILRQIEHLQVTGIGDPRWLAIAKTGFERAFMALNRAVFQPSRVRLSDDPSAEG